MAAVGGLDPSVLVAPDYQTQMLQAQRRLAMASQLQQMALTDTPGNGGTVSWTQGLARALDGFIGGKTANKAYQQMQGANQGYANALRGMFGAPPVGQGAPTAGSGSPSPQQLGQALQGPSTGVPGPQVAPPQAAPPQPSAPSPAPTGGASQPGPMSLTGNPQRDMALYMMNPEEYSKQLAAVAAKSVTPTDLSVQLQQSGIDPNSALGRQIMQGNIAKQNYIPPVSFRPGGWSQDASGQLSYHPQAPAPGAMPVMGPNGPTGAWTDDPSAANIQAQQAGAIAGAQAGAKAPFETVPGFVNGQPVTLPKSTVTGGILNGIYHPGSGAVASGPALGKEAAYGTYGKQSADAFMETQGISKESPQRVQALREMQSLISGPNAMATGPTAAKMQQLAEEHGLPFGYSSNAFVFNKDAARFVAQSASDLGLNGSDARLGMMAHASPNMTMTPQALKTVIPTMIGLEYAKMAKATAASSWAQSQGPDTNAQFESTWRKAYDPRMFTAYAEGGPQALAKAPANLRQQWLKDYRQLKGMGVDFTQFAQ